MELLMKVMHISLMFRVSVTSWIRTTKRNLEVGGHPRSQHVSGTAIDIVPDEFESWDEIAEFARRLGLIAIIEPSHIHLQLLEHKK